MSDKDKNPDFSFEIDEDDLALDENIFEAEDVKKEDEVLTEEELESLIIGIDEENDILDIPDEEEVLEELKFFDENFTLPADKEEIKKEEEKVEKTKKKFKFPKFSKKKKEKKEKEPFDFKFFIIKNKFKLLIGFVLIIILSFAGTFFIVLKSNKHKEEVVEGKENTAKSENSTEEQGEVSKSKEESSHSEPQEKSQGEEPIKESKEMIYLMEKIKNTEDEAMKLKLEKEIEKLKKEAIMKVKEKKALELKNKYDKELKTVKTALIKDEDKTLVVAFVVLEKSYEKEIYEALTEAFKHNPKTQVVNFNILDNSNGLKKIGEINIDKNKFLEVSKLNKSIEEKLLMLNYTKRE